MSGIAWAGADLAPARESAAPRSGASAFPMRTASLVCLAISTLLAVAAYAEVAARGKAVLGCIVALAAIYVASTAPRRLPMMLVAYLPYGICFPFAVPGVPAANMTNLLLVLAAACWFGGRIRPVTRPALAGFELVLLGYVGCGLLAFLHTVSLGAGMGFMDMLLFFKRWVTPFLLYFMVRGLLEDRDDMASLLRALAWTAFLIACLTWSEGLVVSGRPDPEAARAGGVLQQPNSMGAFLVYYGVPLLAFAVSARGWTRRALHLAGFLVAVRALVFTVSRGAYLAMLVGAASVLLLRSPLYFLGAAGAGAVAAPLVGDLLPAQARARLDKTTSEDADLSADIYDQETAAGLDRSSRDRLYRWRAGIEMVKDHPLLGVGLGRFPLVLADYIEVPLEPGQPRDAHNAYVLAAAELGLPGIALMTLLLLWLAARALALYFRSGAAFDHGLALAFLGSLAGVVVSCLFGSRFSDESLIGIFWMLAALVSLARHRSGEEREEARA